MATELADGTTIPLDTDRTTMMALLAAVKGTIIRGLLPGLLEASIGLATGWPGWRNKARRLPEVARQRLAQASVCMSSNL